MGLLALCVLRTACLHSSLLVFLVTIRLDHTLVKVRSYLGLRTRTTHCFWRILLSYLYTAVTKSRKGVLAARSRSGLPALFCRSSCNTLANMSLLQDGCFAVGHIALGRVAQPFAFCKVVTAISVSTKKRTINEWPRTSVLGMYSKSNSLQRNLPRALETLYRTSHSV